MNTKRAWTETELWNLLYPHLVKGHYIEVVWYGDVRVVGKELDRDIANISIECDNCGTVLLDVEASRE